MQKVCFMRTLFVQIGSCSYHLTEKSNTFFLSSKRSCSKNALPSSSALLTWSTNWNGSPNSCLTMPANNVLMVLRVGLDPKNSRVVF